jgi:hypothetical protein
MGNGGMSPGILDPHHWRWGRAVIFVVEPLYLDKVVAGPSVFLKTLEKDKPLFLPGMEPQFLVRPFSSVVTIVTELSRLNLSDAFQRNSSFFKILSCITEAGLQDLRRFLELYSSAVV